MNPCRQQRVTRDRENMKLLGPLLIAIGEGGPLDAVAACAALDRRALFRDSRPVSSGSLIVTCR